MVTHDPERATAEAQLDFARILLQKGMQDEAIATLQTAVHLAPAFAAAHVLLGKSLQDRGDLDGALESYLAALQAEPGNAEAQALLHAPLVLQMKREQHAAVCRDAERLQVTNPADDSMSTANISKALLVQAAEVFIKQNRYAIAHLTCRYLYDHGYKDKRVFDLLAQISRDLGNDFFTAFYLALASCRQPPATDNPNTKPEQAHRFHLIKAWGFGFWSDVDHVLGQLLLAEITNRTPVIHWGANSLFNNNPSMDGFSCFFEPVSKFTVANLSNGNYRYFPDKWNHQNLLQEDCNKWQEEGSRLAALYFLERYEEVTVSDFHNSLGDILSWVMPGHPLHGCEPMEAYRYLFQKYLHIRPQVQQQILTDRRRFLDCSPLLAVHARGSDKHKEESDLDVLNRLYHREIEVWLNQYPALKIFLLTDSQTLLADYQQRYGSRLIHCPCSRTDSDEGIHYKPGENRFKLGLEVLEDVLLATNCDFFLGNGSSNVSCAIAYIKKWLPENVRLLGANMLLQYRFGFCNEWLRRKPSEDESATGLSAPCINKETQLQQCSEQHPDNRALSPALPEPAVEENPILKYAVLLMKKGMAREAIDTLQLALHHEPGSAKIHCQLGRILRHENRIDEAEQHFRQAILLDPNQVEALSSLAQILADHNLDEAAVLLERALALAPDSASALNNLGVILQQLGRDSEAMDCFRRASILETGNTHAYINMGLLLAKQALFCQAIDCFRKAIGLDPNSVEAPFSLGNVLLMQGKAAAAAGCYRDVLDRRPNQGGAQCNLLYTMLYLSQSTAAEIYAAHADFGASLATTPSSHHANVMDPHRRLRIGYVSADFRSHSVAYFLAPVLAHHCHKNFEIFCYSNNSYNDSTTTRLMGYADHWRDIANLNDCQAEQLIRHDNIDILIDLSGHTSRNRLLLFALRPSPLQATWLGYPNTTGLSAIDYRIVDDVIAPTGAAEELHTERLLRLPGNFCCYEPDQAAPEVCPLPAEKNNYITFASCNNLAKVTAEMLDLWSSILKKVPNSRLYLKSKAFLDNASAEMYRNEFARRGVNPETLLLFGWEESKSGHLGFYNQVDIALDTYPYNGATTTCEALWMGVPVITLTGDRLEGLTGKALLTSVGLSDLVASSPEGYKAIAVELANNRRKLVGMRQMMRERLLKSPLLDAVTFTRIFENGLRSIWVNRSTLRH